MRKYDAFLTPAVFVLAAIVALLAAWGSMHLIERASTKTVRDELILMGHEWVDVSASGLQIILAGEAPNEATRYRVLTIAGQEVDASRVVDQMEVPPAEAITPPRFSVEILRNDAGISMIGLIPTATDREALNQQVQRITIDRQVTDLLESADYAVPDGWDAALDYALEALDMLPRSKISMDANRVSIEAIADSAEQKREWEGALSRATPGGLRVALEISAPRPVITPFTLRFTIDENGSRFDACSAHTEAGRTKIVAAGIAAGVNGRPECTIGLGVPSPDWPDAVSTAIAALNELGGGSITFSDADVTLVAAPDVSQSNFDRVVGELEADLPEVFSLHSVLPEPVTIDGTGESVTPEFVATRNADGNTVLRGRVADEAQRTVTNSYARARFGVDDVYAATRLDPDLPQGWQVRVLAGLEALSLLDNGSVVVQPEVVDVRGETGNPDGSDEVSRVLSEKLGESEDFRVNVTYVEALDPIAALPTPQECIASVNNVLQTSVKITFAPGSANIIAGASPTLDALADVIRECPDVAMEIGGYTDSQGREEMNQALSQQRANAVLSALLGRRVLTSSLTAHGYGEENPIADNGTEEGREANRRIEFRLMATADEDRAPIDAEIAAEGQQATPADSEASPEAATDDQPVDEDTADTETPDETFEEEAIVNGGDENVAPPSRPASISDAASGE